MKIQSFVAKLLLLKLAIMSVVLIMHVLALPSFAQFKLAPNPSQSQSQSQLAPNPSQSQSQLAPASQNISIVFGASSQKLASYYVPPSVKVRAGTIVTWINNDNAYHTVTFVAKGLYDSGIILPNHYVSYAFFQQGTFDYYCKIHPYMTGELTIF